MMRGMSLAVLGAVVLCGCAETGAGAGAGGVDVRDSAGVRIVVNHVTGEDVPLRVEEVLRVGVVDGDEHYMFSRISAMATDREGNLYVANDQSNTVRVFTPDGEFLREFCGPGGGPAGFRNFVAVSVVGDTVAVLGTGTGPKAALFSRQGDLLESWNLVESAGIVSAPLAFIGTGWIGVRMTLPGRMSPGAESAVQMDVVEVFPQLDSAGPTLVSLPPLELHGNHRGEPISGLFRTLRLPSVDSAGRIYFAVDSLYRIDVFERDGHHVLRVIREIDPIPLGQQDVEEVVALAAARWDTATVLYGVDRATWRKQSEERIREQAELMPAHISPVRRVQVQRNGGFWAERIDQQRPAEDGAGLVLDPDLRHSTRWDVFGPDGVYHLTVDLPPRFAPFIVTDSSATGVIKDDLDVEYVVTYRVPERRRVR